MKFNWSAKLVAMSAILVLSGCSGISVPIHTPANISYVGEWSVARKDIHKGSPFKDGTPRYWTRLSSGSHVTLGGNLVEDSIYPDTNADTQGTQLLDDGSTVYFLTIQQYSSPDNLRKGYLITKIDSEKKREEIASAEKAKRKAEDEKKALERQAKRVYFKSRQCFSVLSYDGYFCYDNNDKLTWSNVEALSALLSRISNKMISSYCADRYCLGRSFWDDPTEVGKWFIEESTSKTIRITIVYNEKILGETVIDKSEKAGHVVYLEREGKTKTFDIIK